MQTQYSKSGKR